MTANNNDIDPMLEQLGRDFDAELAEEPGDSARLQQAVTRALAAPAPPRSIGRRRLPWLLAAAALFAGAALATQLGRKPAGVAPTPSSFTAVTLDEPTAPLGTTESAPAPATAAPSASPESSSEPSPVLPAPSSSAGAPPSAASLFSRANQARRDRHDADAIRLYRELQRRYPDSREASASRVTLGQLLLDRTAPSEALGEFERYLEKSPGEVSEEALAGRARALGKLGRASEERAAWQTLLQRYPSSLHAAEAKRRLAAIGN
ncbi:MAG: tetratricopeptide repeat protein [Myxococcales bacterium]|nr:tetratricopeptide repeat protein [Myxococcales bacterium]